MTNSVYKLPQDLLNGLILIVKFLIKLVFPSQMSTFSRISDHRWKFRKQKNLSDNPGANILEFYFVLVQV